MNAALRIFHSGANSDQIVESSLLKNEDKLCGAAFQGAWQNMARGRDKSCLFESAELTQPKAS